MTCSFYIFDHSFPKTVEIGQHWIYCLIVKIIKDISFTGSHPGGGILKYHVLLVCVKVKVYALYAE